VLEDLEIIDLIYSIYPTEFKKHVEPRVEEILRPIINDIYNSIGYDIDRNFKLKKQLEAINESYKIDVEFELCALEDRINDIKTEERRLQEEEYNFSL
jgi:hypothetical protein